jgi:hypothetical protein
MASDDDKVTPQEDDEWLRQWSFSQTPEGWNLTERFKQAEKIFTWVKTGKVTS